MSKLPPLSRLKLIGCHVCKFTLSTQKVCSYISRVWLWESDGMRTNTLLLYREGRKGEMLDCMAWTLSDREKQKLTVAEVELNPIGLLIPSLSQQSKSCSNYIPRLWARVHHIVGTLQTCEPRRLIVIGRKHCIYGLHLSKRYIYRHGFFFPRND